MDDQQRGSGAAADDALWAEFVSPPDDVRPRVWWHWMDGNVDVPGIRRDLAWLHEVGVRGVQLFDGSMGGPLVVPEPVRPGSAAWQEAVSTTASEAERLGMEVAVATSAGWSASGAPWVAPADAMKKVVWSEASVDGGAPLTLALPSLPDVAGPYQDCPRWGSAPDASFAADWVVLALPADPGHEPLLPDAVHTAPGLPPAQGAEHPAILVDGSFASGLALPRDPDAPSRAAVEQWFDEAVTVRSVAVGLPGPSGFGAAPAASAVLEASDDGDAWRTIVDLPPGDLPVRSAGFAPVTARRFRLVLTGEPAASALPPTALGVRLPPVLRRTDAFTVTQFALRSAGRVHRAEVKAGFGVVPDYYAIDTPAESATPAPAPAEVIDLTGFVADGVLRWTPPPGRWTILRLGVSLTGSTNGPAAADVTGLEVDKLDGQRVAAYLDRYLPRYGIGADGGNGVHALLSDSMEAGQQNVTERMREHFVERRGYDPTPWLPTLTGVVIGDAERSDRFLYDWRRTIADLIADEYYGTLGAAAHRRGMTLYAEALEDRRPQLGDDLAMRAHADVPMGAMWTFDPTAGPRPTYVADLKGAASVAHVHGKRAVGSEAFTSFDSPWTSTPRSLKHVADLQLALGVTRFCIHTSPHQPLSAPRPGIALAPFLGQTFTVNETWAGMARPWIDYLARCSAMLSAGEPVVDLAVFVGEEAPVTGLFGDHLDDTVPRGFSADYVGPVALAEVLHVDGGDIVSVGARYRALYLGGSTRRMTIAALSQLERLVDAGGALIGIRPERSPSLADDPEAFAAACDRIWGVRERERVVATADLAHGLAQLGIRPTMRVAGGDVRWIARDIGGRRVTFVANPAPRDVEITVGADPGPLELWDPVTTGRTPATRTDDGAVAIRLAPFQSVLLVAGDGRPTPQVSAADAELAGPWRLTLGDDTVTDGGLALWTGSPSGRAFSGTGVYRTEFHVDAGAARAGALWLDLGDVRDIARVSVNGTDCGVAWTAPFAVEVTHAVHVGRNELEVQVANPWRNRLIAEAAAPSGDILPSMAAVFEPSADPLPAGLAGPVRLITRVASTFERISATIGAHHRQ